VPSYARTGKKVFSAATVSALLVKHMHEALSAPSERAPGPLPAGLDASVLRCRAKSPTERYADGAKLAEARRALDLGGAVTTTSATTEAATAGASVSRARAPAGASSRA
jgi:hypothetical protein